MKGTGVLLQLRDRYFILTAGHVVEDLRHEIKQHTVALGVLGPKTGLNPTIVRFEYEYAGARDVGVMELPAVDTKLVKDISSNYFVRQSELAVGDVGDVAPLTDGYVILGYPSSLYEGDREGRWMYQAGNLAMMGSPRLECEQVDRTNLIELPYRDHPRARIAKKSCEARLISKEPAAVVAGRLAQPLTPGA